MGTRVNTAAGWAAPVRWLLGLAVVVAASAVTAQPALAATYTVPCPTDEAASGQALADAVASGNDNTDLVIELTAGCTYTVRSASDDDPFLAIRNSMTIHGNGARVERPSNPEMAIVFDVWAGASLSMSDITLSGVTPRRFMRVRTDAAAALDNLTIDHGGAGIYSDGRLTVTDSSFEGINAHSIVGGAIENDAHGTLVVERTAFTGNSVLAPQGNLQAGGAVANRGQAYIGESTFAQNISFTGGAIWNVASLDVRDTTFDRNEATLDGGVLYQHAGSSLFLRDTFTANEAIVEGGALHANGGNVTVNESTFAGNRAVGVFRNSETWGGAVYSGTVMSLDHDTFANNQATHGSAIYRDDPDHTLTMSGTVLSGSSDPCAGDTTIVDAGYNMTWPFSSACPSSFAVAFPKLGSLGDHGGLTDTILPLVGSPLLDAVPTSACPTKDQRSLPRPAGPACDIGSVEDQLPTAPGTVTQASGTNPNRGAFGVSWTGSTDAEGAVTYRLLRADDDDSAPTVVTTTSSTTYTFLSSAPEQEGTLRYWVEAVDTAGAATRSGSASDPIVSDRSAPTGLTATADSAPDYDGPGTGDEWYADTVTVSFSGASDPDLADGSAGSGISTTDDPETFTTSGSHTATGTATDAAGNISQTASLTVQVDADNPTVSFGSCPSMVLLHATSSAGWSASDASSDLQSTATGSVPLDTSTVGPHQVQSPAPTDNVGHSGTAATCSYTVIYDFAGFLGLPAYPGFTTIKAKDGLTVRFSLAGDQGLDVLAAGSPTVVPVSCSTGAPIGTSASAETKRGLTYNSSTASYSYQWLTDPGWAKTCRQLVVTLADGTVHRQNVQLK
jgi:hypothetical protein